MNIFIHRRDLRIIDNTSLYYLYKQTKQPINSIFIFTPEQIDKDKNPYFSNNLVYFLCQSLLELKKEYQKNGGDLYFFYGDVIEVLTEINKNYKINNIGFNLDYSPYAKKRDKTIINWCQKHNINTYCQEDMLLVNIIDNKNYPKETPYKVFTPFMNYQKKNFNINKPVKNKIKYQLFENKDKNNNKNHKDKNIKYLINEKDLKQFYKINKNLHVKPGRKMAKKTLLNLKNKLDYSDKRNILSYETSNLSAYINLGLLSIREVYDYASIIFGEDNSFINELYWRDFYYNILYHYPHVVGDSFKKEYDNIQWNNNEELFKKWCQGKTGFPIVDACMTQLNKTGYMHNRGRMIVASFLTKDLFIDWRKGEKYFAIQLVDYNISANNGGWQWASGSGTDAQPYFRIFNPHTQSENFDKDCKYIKKWLPQLKTVENKHIHQWNKYYYLYPNIDYYKPIIEHKTQYYKTIELYKKYL